MRVERIGANFTRGVCPVRVGDTLGYGRSQYVVTRIHAHGQVDSRNVYNAEDVWTCTWETAAKARIKCAVSPRAAVDDGQARDIHEWRRDYA